MTKDPKRDETWRRLLGYIIDAHLAGAMILIVSQDDFRYAISTMMGNNFPVTLWDFVKHEAARMDLLISVA